MDKEDPQYDQTRIEMWVSGSDFFVECDIWIRLQFPHILDVSKPMREMPRTRSLPEDLYFRVVSRSSSHFVELVKLPGGVAMIEKIRYGINIKKVSDMGPHS